MPPKEHLVFRYSTELRTSTSSNRHTTHKHTLPSSTHTQISRQLSIHSQPQPQGNNPQAGVDQLHNANSSNSCSGGLRLKTSFAALSADQDSAMRPHITAHSSNQHPTQQHAMHLTAHSMVLPSCSFCADKRHPQCSTRPQLQLQRTAWARSRKSVCTRRLLEG